MTRTISIAVVSAFLAVAYTGGAIAQDQTKTAPSTKAKSRKPKAAKGTNSTVRQPTTRNTSGGAEGAPGETSGPAPKQN